MSGKSNIYNMPGVSNVSNVSNMSDVSNMSKMSAMYNVSNMSDVFGVSKVSDLSNMYTATVQNVKLTNNLVFCRQWHQTLCNIAKIPKMVAAHIDPMDLEPSARDQK